MHTVEGETLPEVEDATRWLLDTDDDGIARFGRGKGRFMTYVRSRKPVRVTAP